MKKRILTLLLALGMLLSLAACGEQTAQTEDTQSEPPAAAEVAEPAEEPAPIQTGKVEGTIDFTALEGRLVYKGWKYATCPNIQIDGETDGNIILVYFEYTNYTDIERPPVNSFWVWGYQNGVQLPDSCSWSGDANQSEETKAIFNGHTNLLKGASMEYACPFLLTDDSPVTLIAHTYSTDETQQIVIDPS